MLNLPIKEEKISLSFKLKKCMKNFLYKISLILEDSSSNNKENFETEEKKALENNSEITFDKKLKCIYYFGKEQKITISITKENPIDANYKFKIIKRITSLSSLICSPNSLYERELQIDNKEIICIELNNENNYTNKSEKKYLIFDYFKSGLKLLCFLSMDFSELNNNSSLKDNKDNYINILNIISNAISNYTENQLFYVSGFGGKDKDIKSNNSIFNLNKNLNDSSVHTIQTVIQQFKNCIEYNFIEPENKINLSSMIKNIIKNIYKIYEIKNYYASFIIIRADINNNDKKEIINSIIESSYLPLTIFIIGVGNNNFSNLKKIVLNHKYMYSSLGMEKRRDNIFFNFSTDDFFDDEQKLISWFSNILYEQILSFYSLSKIYPENILENKINNKENGFNIYNSSFWINDNEMFQSCLFSLNSNMSCSSGGTQTPLPNSSINNINIEKEKSVNKIENLSNITPMNDIENKETQNIVDEYPSKKYINEKPNLYGSLLDNSNIKKDKSSSLSDEIKINTDNGENRKNNEENLETSKGNYSDEKKYIITTSLVNEQNEDKKNNNNNLKSSNETNLGNTEQSSYMKRQKSSEINIKKNIEIIKSSFSLFNSENTFS